jgi:hypothetical protein
MRRSLGKPIAAEKRDQLGIGVCVPFKPPVEIRDVVVPVELVTNSK